MDDYLCAMFLKALKKHLPFLGILFLALTFAGCSEYSKVVKSSDVDYKYTKAVQYYNKGDYNKALSLFDELGTLLRGSDRSEDIHYYIASCHYNLHDYYFASYYYKNFTKTYPHSERAETALFRSAYCSYLNSPKPSLDQTDTDKAISEFQLFLNRYPLSTMKDSANTMVFELREKLELKAYANAKLYYTTSEYKSATLALRNVLKDFPASPHREEIEFLIVKSSYLLAMNSVASKKEERLNTTIDNYHRFVDSYSNSRFINEAEGFYANAIRELDRMKF